MNFNELNIHNYDKNLSTEERAEWNSIYASYRSGSLLSGMIAGVDNFIVNKNGERMLAAVVILYRVKILIPEKLLWNDYDSIPKAVTKNMLGAKIDFVIKKIDRENDICTASRVAAMRIRRKQFFNGNPKEKDRINCNILAVGRKRLIAEACGFDLRLRATDLCYTDISDFRLRYCTGQALAAVIKEVSRKDKILRVSVRDAKAHPYAGIKNRHPVGCRRASVITGKYKGFVFCRLEDDFDCLCNYSEYQSDDDFDIGSKVIIAVKDFNDAEKRVYGVIVSKWN